MFAAATREVVFANPEVVRRVNEQFIPVALKAALVNNPPSGVEGQLYAEIGRSKPAPQGICTANSDGKVLAWALSFDDDASILKFLDHALQRYRQHPDASVSGTAQRYMKFPSRKLNDVSDNDRRIRIPADHGDQQCPGTPVTQAGTLVGTIIGRALNENGKPVSDTVLQEHYMEARTEFGVDIQQQLWQATRTADGDRFRIPDDVSKALVAPAFLGQLDVDPLGLVPGSKNDHRHWDFHGQQVESGSADVTRIRIEGRSDVAGGQDAVGNRTDGRLWQHRVTLAWCGFIELQDHHVSRLTILAEGEERLRWGNERFDFQGESAAQHLMAGHPIDLECGVRYGLTARSER